jgi:hypothetical protein
VTADLSESYLIFECLQWSVQVHQYHILIPEKYSF